LAVFLMVTALEESQKVKKRKRCTWVQPWLQNRPTPITLYTDVNTTLFVNITWQPMRTLDFSHVTPSFSDGIELWLTQNKFLAREKTRARMHDIRTEFFLRVSRTSFLDGRLSWALDRHFIHFTTDGVVRANLWCFCVHGNCHSGAHLEGIFDMKCGCQW